ncbi:DUF3301 domain-containing protein [Thiohalobacter sp. IOR34]|uniref:DUF3301 domain-containing protein n=1 Tax=Thiohalobacter sp. IOR34 TaxID=3057176 RepID=UPI0025B1BAD2|nr:DUF3301 domain-containing protein [Thiohalobacter sp. IOR34]WJW76106.1 DUF3301 domain-containing protein [Thiohalobacter sp. IOR34]
MDNTLWLLLLLAAGGWFWLDGLAARDRAVALARDTCERSGVQLLDGTVSLSALRLRRNPAGRVTLQRSFRFDYSSDGASRRQGFVVLLGRRLEAVGLAAEEAG